jgi:hypothetical protein
MYDLGNTASLTAALESDEGELAVIMRRVEQSMATMPRYDPSAWSGPASWAYQVSLGSLGREVSAALELLRCAVDLTAAAVFELDARG